MHFRFVIALALAVVPVCASSAMPVSAFLDKAAVLKRKGSPALLSGDRMLLTKQILGDAKELKAANHAAAAAGKPKAYCAPPGGVKLTSGVLLAIMETVPPAERDRTTTKDALRNYLARRYPCKT